MRYYRQGLPTNVNCFHEKDSKGKEHALFVDENNDTVWLKEIRRKKAKTFEQVTFTNVNGKLKKEVKQIPVWFKKIAQLE